jgi:hypothetical protein
MPITVENAAIKNIDEPDWIAEQSSLLAGHRGSFECMIQVYGSRDVNAEKECHMRAWRPERFHVLTSRRSSNAKK